MKKIPIPFFLLFLFCCTTVSFGQLRTVSIDDDLLSFEGNTPLPAQVPFQLKGSTESYISRVTLEVFKNPYFGHQPDFRSQWVRTFGYTKDVFTIPVYYPLRSGQAYSFRIRRYRELPPREQISLQNQLYQALDSYIDAQVRFNNEKLNFEKPAQTMVDQLNQIVTDGLQYYESSIGAFDGFSDIVRDKIKAAEDRKFEFSKMFRSRQDTMTTDPAIVTRELNELKAVVHHELDYYFNETFYKLTDTKEIRDYPTEKLPNVIGINVGYAVATLNNNWDDLNYATAPYAGLSFPLGNAAFAPFMNRLSVSAGVFLTNIKGQQDREFTGPFVKRPIYAGLGYRFFDFVRINAGAVVLEQTTNGSSNDVLVRPFVGLSADFSVWIGVGSKVKTR